MNGLIKNHFYAVLSNMKLFSVFLSAVVLFTLISGNELFVNLIGYLLTVSVTFLSLFSYGRENKGKWKKYLIASPISRSDTVKSHYLCALLWTLLSAAATILFLFSVVLIHSNRYFYYGLRDIFTLLAVSVCISLLICAFFYPIVHFSGEFRWEVSLFLSLLLAVGCSFGIISLLNFLFADFPQSNRIFYLQLFLFTLSSVCLFLLSFLLCLRLCRREEY